jgi:hypothetical protein
LSAFSTTRLDCCFPLSHNTTIACDKGLYSSLEYTTPRSHHDWTRFSSISRPSPHLYATSPPLSYSASSTTGHTNITLLSHNAHTRLKHGTPYLTSRPSSRQNNNRRQRHQNKSTTSILHSRRSKTIASLQTRYRRLARNQEISTQYRSSDFEIAFC